MSQDLWVDFLGRFGLLILFMAVLVFLFYLFRRYMGAGRAGNRKWIKILSVHYISHKEKLMLVQVPGQVLLVGVTPSRISHISTLPSDAVLAKNKNIEMEKFSGVLEEALVHKGQNDANA